MQPTQVAIHLSAQTQSRTCFHVPDVLSHASMTSKVCTIISMIQLNPKVQLKSKTLGYDSAVTLATFQLNSFIILPN